MIRFDESGQVAFVTDARVEDRNGQLINLLLRTLEQVREQRSASQRGKPYRLSAVEVDRLVNHAIATATR